MLLYLIALLSCRPVRVVMLAFVLISFAANLIMKHICASVFGTVLGQQRLGEKPVCSKLVCYTIHSQMSYKACPADKLVM